MMRREGCGLGASILRLVAKEKVDWPEGCVAEGGKMGQV